MATIMGLANCATPDSMFNVGIPLCDIPKGKFRGVILLDKGVTFSGAALQSLAAFIAELKTKTTAARGSRAYPIFDLLNFEDNTGDPATGGTGNLTTATIITNDAVPAFRFGYNGTEKRHARMSLISSMSLDAMFVDDKYTVYGFNNDGAFGGYTVLQPYADVSKFVVADAVNQYSFRLTLGDISQYKENSTYVVTNASLFGAKGLVDVEMSEVASLTVDNVFKIKMISDGGTDLEPLHGSTIAGLTFTATNLQTGAAFTVTSTADDTTNDALTVTLDSTAWTALSVGDQIQINPPSAAALAAAGVKPYEFFPVIVTKLA